MLTLHKLQLTGPSGSVRITATEATLLQAFAQATDARLNFQQIADCCGLSDADAVKASAQVRMVRLRKKLHQAGADGAVIEAIRNVGYQLFEPIQVVKT